MAVFKCKMCGASLEIVKGSRITECRYCETMQTLPLLDDDRRINLYDRANHFRRNNEFDKAMSIYESILNEDGTDSEAYWSLILCKYGIEYVEDPATHKRKITCNRTQGTSIFADEDYKSAIEHASDEARAVYMKEAEEIDRIQKGILAISAAEEPYDVFICYKESDKDGRRTEDSVLAQELYFELKKQGFRVFFSRISLENKLGTAYEPYIFAALRSARAMIVLATRPEYANAPWVKNEWARFLAMTKTDPEKFLIPAYRDMSPYDLPEEFSHLQAQDMSKLGFMQDLIRGIEKLVKHPDPSAKSTESGAFSVPPITDVAPLFTRAYMCLEDREFSRADELFEQILNREPKNAEAYAGKLTAALKCRKRAELGELKYPFEQNGNYIKVLRFGSEELKREITGYNERVTERRAKEKAEAQIKAKAIAKKAHRIGAATLVGALSAAAVALLIIFLIIPSVKYKAAEKLFDDGDYRAAASAFAELDGFRDSEERYVECFKKLYGEETRVASSSDYSYLSLTSDGVLSVKHRAQVPATLSIPSVIDGVAVREIDDEAFKGCKSLVNLTIPNTVTRVGASAFEGCTSLASVNVENIQKWVEYDFPDVYANPLYYAKKLLVGGVCVDTLEIPEGTSRIGKNAFYGTTSLTRIVIPSSVSEIGESAFNSCTGLTGVHISDLAKWCEISFINSDSNPLKYASRLYLNNTLVSNLAIPSEVLKISDYAFYGCKSLRTVTVPESVEWIGSAAFRDCSGISEMTIPFVGQTEDAEGFVSCFGYIFGASSYIYNSKYVPESLKTVTVTAATEIKSNVFWECRNLKTVILSDTIEKMGDYIFQHCESLKDLTVPFIGETIDGNETFDYIFGKEDDVPSSLRNVIVLRGEKIPSNAFYFCKNIESITVPNTVTSIGSYAFYCCRSLTSIAIPETVTEIGVRAFDYCEALAELHITDIEKWANIDFAEERGEYSSNPLKYANGLYLNGELVTVVAIPEGAKTVSAGAFACYENLLGIMIPDSVDSIGEAAFQGCANLADVRVGNGIKSIGTKAFSDCVNLKINTYDNAKYIGNESNPYVVLLAAVDKEITSCEINENTKIIQNNAFYNCKVLASIVIPDSVVELGELAFYGCSKLESATLSSGITKVSYQAFFECKSLSSIIIPQNVIEIEFSAFSHCENLTSVVIPDSVTTIEDFAFESCRNLTNVTIGAGITSIGSRIFSECNNLKYNTYDNAYYLGNESNPYVMLMRTVDKDITRCLINENTKYIYDTAFFYCTKLASISLPDGITLIGEMTFVNCENLVSITIPESVIFIGSQAFYECYGLKRVVFEDVSNWYKAWSSNITQTDVSDPIANVEVFIHSDSYEYWYKE